MGISANDDGALYSANKNDDKYHTFQDPIQLCQTMTMDRFKAAKSNAGIHQEHGCEAPRGGWIGESDQALWLQDSSVGKVNGNGSGPFVISWAFIIHNHQH